MSEVEEHPTLPVFPLTGVLLLPEVRMPLHVFEPRYRNLVRDVLNGSGELGMIQPRGSTSKAAEAAGQPALYDVGCVGLLEKHEHLDDGRYLILLRGTRRFKAVRELALSDGYRRLVVRYDAFRDGEDDDPISATEAAGLLQTVRELATQAKVTLDLKRLRGLSSRCLVHTLAAGLPFSPPEKQALLECPTASDRLQAISALFEMGFDLRGERGGAPSVAN